MAAKYIVEIGRKRIDITKSVAAEIASRPIHERAECDPYVVAHGIFENMKDANPTAEFTVKE